MDPTKTPRIRVDVDAYRQEAGISVLELSVRTGIPRTTLRRKIANPGLFTFDELHDIANVLNMPAEAFTLGLSA